MDKKEGNESARCSNYVSSDSQSIGSSQSSQDQGRDGE